MMTQAGRGGSPPGSLGRQLLYQKCNSIKYNETDREDWNPRRGLGSAAQNDLEAFLMRLGASQADNEH